MPPAAGGVCQNFMAVGTLKRGARGKPKNMTGNADLTSRKSVIMYLTHSRSRAGGAAEGSQGQARCARPWDASGASILALEVRGLLAPFQGTKNPRELDPGAARPAVACT